MPISCHFQDCKSASDLESVSCKKRYSKYWTLPFYSSAKDTIVSGSLELFESSKEIIAAKGAK